MTMLTQCPIDDISTPFSNMQTAEPERLAALTQFGQKTSLKLVLAKLCALLALALLLMWAGAVVEKMSHYYLPGWVLEEAVDKPAGAILQWLRD